MTDLKSEAAFTESDSQSSQRSCLNVDIETLRLGQDNIVRLVIENLAILFIPGIFSQMVVSLELSQIIKFCGQDAINTYTITQPLIFLFTIGIPRGLAHAANTYIQKNISKQQIIAAQIYLAHYVIVSILFIILIIVLYFVVLKSLVQSQVAGQYLMLRMVVGVIVNTFGFSQDCFFETENREFVLMSKNFIANCIYSICLQVCFINSSKLGVSMTNAGVAYVISAAYAMLHMSMVLSRIPFIDIQYRGVLKFYIKKLQPIRWRMLGQIFAHGLQNLLVTCSQQIIYFEIALLNRFTIRQPNILFIQNMKLLAYVNFMSYAQMVNEIFQLMFEKLVTYNIGIKKITRIWEILKWTLIFHCSIGLPAFIVFASFADMLTTLLFPVTVPDTLYQYSMDNIGTAPMLGVVAQILRQTHYLISVMMTAEGKLDLAVCVQLPSFLFVAIYGGFLFYQIRDNAPSTMIMCLGEISNFILGWGFLIYYMIKYRGLFMINKKNLQKQPLNDKESQQQLRKTVAEQLLVGIEHHKKYKKQVSTLFDKMNNLAQNDNFFSLRDALIKVRPESMLINNRNMSSEEFQAQSKNNASYLTDNNIPGEAFSLDLQKIE